MEKAVIYARQSSGDEEQSESIEMQLEKCRELARRENLEIVGEFTDYNTTGRTYPTGAESIAELDKTYQEWFRNQTGSRKYRKGLGDAIEKAVSEKASLVIFDITRLYRPVSGSYLESYISQRLNGVRIHSTKGKIDLGSFGDSLITTITNRINDDQLRTQKEKSILGLRKLRDEGRYYGVAPLGFRYDKNSRSYIANPMEIEVIKKCFQWFLNGVPVAEICRRMDSQWPVKKARTGDYTMRRLLRKPEYCGLTRNSKGELVNLKDGLFDCFPVSKADWYKVQNLLGDRRMRPAKQRIYNYALNGLVRCGYCGKAMTMTLSPSTRSKEAGRIITTYKCMDGVGRTSECRFATLKYSIANPVKIGEGVLLNARNPEGFEGHAQRVLSMAGGEPPLENRISGIYEAIQPLLASVCLKTISDADRPEHISERIEEARHDLSDLKARKKTIVGLVAKGLLSESEAEEQLLGLSDAIVAREAELSALESEDDQTGRMAVQKTYARLEKIQEGTLHPDDFRDLFLRKFTSVEVFDTRVILHLLNGREIELSKNLSRCTTGMPQSRLEVKRLAGGVFKAVVTYWYNSAFVSRHRDDTESVIYEDDELKVVTIGHCESHSHHKTSEKREEFRRRMSHNAK